MSGFGYGSMVDIKNNKRKHIDKLQRYIEQTGSSINYSIKAKKNNPLAFGKFIAAYREKQKATRKKQWVTLGIFSGILILVLLYFLFIFDLSSIAGIFQM